MAGSDKPMFSFILAFRNEGDCLESCLKSIDNQTLDRSDWEIILIDGCSSDKSRSIAENYIKTHINAMLLNNPEIIATAGWNIGIKASSGKYFCLTSGHSVLDNDFLLKAKEKLNSDNQVHALGGRIYKVGLDEISKSIAATTNTIFAMGGAYFRVGDKPKKVNTIGNAIFLKEITESIGLFDTAIKRSGDWEFNYRVCKSGFNMYFDPELKIKVFSRSDYKSLFTQQFRTGFWKIKIWTKHRKSLLPRHIVPPLFVLYLLFYIGALFFGIANSIILLFPLLLYFLGIVLSTIITLKEKVKCYYVLPTFPVLHIAYGLGFFFGLFRWGKYLLIPPRNKP